MHEKKGRCINVASPKRRCAHNQFLRTPRARNGAIIPLFAVMLPVVLILGAFAINIAYLELNRTEMVIASDAASRATGREFALSNDQAGAMAKGRTAASLNTVGGRPLLLADGDFIFGQSARASVSDRYSFTPGGAFPNAVEVTTRRTVGSPSGPVNLPLPGFFSSTAIESRQTSRSNQIEVDIALVIDRSGSMAYGANEVAQFPPIPAAAPAGWFFGDPAPNPSRWRDAVAAVDVFLNELTNSPVNEFVSLSTYNDGTNLEQLLTTNYNSIRGSLDFYTQSFTSGATNIGGGIESGINALSINSRPFAAKVMIVLTDGIDTVGSNPIAAADHASDEQIMVFTITFSAEADQATMQQVAVKGNGKHYHASNGTVLLSIFRDIGRQLPILISR
jgi:Flp pilus assembly protein TadG